MMLASAVTCVGGWRGRRCTSSRRRRSLAGDADGGHAPPQRRLVRLAAAAPPSSAAGHTTRRQVPPPPGTRRHPPASPATSHQPARDGGVPHSLQQKAAAPVASSAACSVSQPGRTSQAQCAKVESAPPTPPPPPPPTTSRRPLTHQWDTPTPRMRQSRARTGGRRHHCPNTPPAVAGGVGGTARFRKVQSTFMKISMTSGLARCTEETPPSHVTHVPTSPPPS